MQRNSRQTLNTLMHIATLVQPNNFYHNLHIIRGIVRVPIRQAVNPLPPIPFPRPQYTYIPSPRKQPEGISMGIEQGGPMTRTRFAEREDRQ
jgi:hypothetical protein